MQAGFWDDMIRDAMIRNRVIRDDMIRDVMIRNRVIRDAMIRNKWKKFRYRPEIGRL